MIQLSDEVLIDAAADIAALTTLELSVEIISELSLKPLKDGPFLRLFVSDKVGTVDVDLTGIEGSFDGTNFGTIFDFPTAVNVSADGEHKAQMITVPLFHCKHIRMKGAISSGTLDGSNNFKLTAELY